MKKNIYKIILALSFVLPICHISYAQTDDDWRKMVNKNLAFVECIGLKKVDSERKSTCLNIEVKKGRNNMDWSPTCISKKVYPLQLFQRKFPRLGPLSGDGFVILQTKTT